MKRWAAVAVVVVVGLLVVPVGLDVGLVQANDEDEMFGDEVLVIDEDSMEDHAGLLLAPGSLDVGGRFGLDVEWAHADADSLMGRRGASAVGSTRLYGDWRPSAATRLFVQGDLELAYPDDGHLDGQLLEWFVDWNASQKVFFRAGKQTVRWGVGYFFSPADVISVGRLDPEEPEALREGPIALRVHYPQRHWDFHLFTLWDDADDGVRVAVAPRVTFVTGRTEWGLGAFYRPDRVPRAMLTVSSTIAGTVAVFGEAVVAAGTDRRYAVLGDDGQLRAESREDLQLQASVGFRVNRRDPDRRFTIGAAGQYFYNGEGYEDTSVLRHPGFPWLLLSGELSLADLRQPGRHYGALSLQWSEPLRTRFSATGLWLGNLDDSSGQLTAQISHRGWNDIRPYAGVTWYYGDGVTEFGFGPTQWVAGLRYSVAF